MVTVANVLESVIREAKAPRRIPLGKIHPSGVELRRFERQGTEQIARALQTLRRRLFAGLNADTVSQVVSRMNDREIIQPFRDTFAALIQEWALAGSDFGREQVERVIFGTQKQVVGIAIDWALANEAAVEWAQNYAYDEFTAALEERIKSRLRKEIINFVRNDETFQSFSRRMASDAMFGKARGQMIAVTEVTRAYAEGNKIAWRESGVTEGMEWNTANDELVCPICGPLDGEQVPLDDKFDGGFEAPPAHPRCRCWLTPVTVGDLETGQEIFDRLNLPGTGEAAGRELFDVADEIALIESGGFDSFVGIRPPPGRAPRGLGTEYAQRRRIVKRIQVQMRHREAATRQIREFRGQTSMRIRWKFDAAVAREQELSKGIATMLDISGDAVADWAFKTEMVDGIIKYMSAIR